VSARDHCHCRRPPVRPAAVCLDCMFLILIPSLLLFLMVLYGPTSASKNSLVSIGESAVDLYLQSEVVDALIHIDCTLMEAIYLH
jgi:hypothetical protein